MNDRIRLKDIASKMNTSVVTVSNALFNKSGVSDSLRREIQSKAEEMGYDMARYRRKRTHPVTIGTIISGRYISVGTSFYWELYQSAVKASMALHAFTLLEILDEHADADAPLPRIVTEKKTDGILLIGMMEDRYIERLIAETQVPVVLLDFYRPKYGCAAVLSENYLGMCRATEYLIDRGHQSIGFIGTPEVSENIRERLFGYRKAMEEHRLPIKEEWILRDRDPETLDVRVNLPSELPEAFACSSDYSAGVLFDALTERGLQVPEDISVIGYDNYLYGSPLAGRLTSFNVDMKSMGREAVSLLLQKIDGTSSFRGVRYIDSTIIERDSVQDLRKPEE